MPTTARARSDLPHTTKRVGLCELDMFVQYLNI